jgi:hypothetical protein
VIARKGFAPSSHGNLPRQNFLYGHSLERLAGTFFFENCVQRHEIICAAAGPLCLGFILLCHCASIQRAAVT